MKHPPIAMLAAILLAASAVGGCIDVKPPTFTHADVSITVEDGCPVLTQTVWGDWEGRGWTVLVSTPWCGDEVTVCPDWPGFSPYCEEIPSSLEVANGVFAALSALCSEISP